MMILHYTLDERGEPVPCADLMEWGRWMETAERKVARDQIGRFDVSTVFLGLDHGFHGGPPVRRETMIFGPEGHGLEDYSERYTSRQAAVAGHAEAVRLAQIAEAAFPFPVTTDSGGAD